MHAPATKASPELGSKEQHLGDYSNFFKKHSGCCKPPIGCRFEYVNATFWTATASGAAVYDSDCFNWRNEQKTLCYNCDSCKAGILEYARKDLRIWAIVNLVLVLFLFGAWLALLFSLEKEETLELH
ncbi:hypothetical protein Patl1_19015 [Pistacia atlantica]|uniref:Uncharacterized protein n=1 Tax=Pistacia atlantica TaxID=434234 RepID=A0ACC1C095_9ROSI|nr:hypothetical protein Patl1_19015 [Pistacia atlantica]